MYTGGTTGLPKGVLLDQQAIALVIYRMRIGLGSASKIRELTVVWPGSETVQIFRDVEPDRIYRVRETAPNLEPIDLPSFRLGRPQAGS